jgi:uncharacterized protein (TIGR02452 family)
MSDIIVKDIDAIDCGLELIEKEGLNPVVLNLADESIPGGCVATGSEAQEESLFRRTSLCATLLFDHRLYPIRPNEGIYSPNVWVIKTNDWKDIDPPNRISFMSVPGLRYPLTDKDSGRLNPEDRTTLETKIKLMLQIAMDNGHDSVVLGATGCGAWKSPPQEVAEAFKEVLASTPLPLKKVAFAILAPKGNVHAFIRNRGRSNFEVFYNQLCEPPI